MKAEGFKFPALRESEAMFSATNAPTWVDGESCHRCRVIFNIITRKHHCRACGQVFCSNCTKNTTTLPKFGIEKEVSNNLKINLVLSISVEIFIVHLVCSKNVYVYYSLFFIYFFRWGYVIPVIQKLQSPQL